jgi:hypothetical protein
MDVLATNILGQGSFDAAHHCGGHEMGVVPRSSGRED